MKSISVLLVDDNKIALRELKDIFRYLGYKDLHEADNAGNAWAMIQKNDYDCVISTWDMPEMSGLALLRILRTDEQYCDFPFFLTDDAFTKAKVIDAGRIGVTGLLLKPFQLENLKGKIATMTEEANALIPAEVQSSFDDGMKLMESADYEEALNVFENLLAQGETPEIYFNIGYIKTVQEEYPEAIEAFRKATQLNNLYAKAYEAMGRAHKAAGNSNAAEECLKKAADIYMDKEKDDKAEEILHEILEETPDTMNIFNTLGVIYRKKGDYQAALKQYEKALKVHPNEPYILYNTGRLFVDMKDLDQAAKLFRRALACNTEFKEAQEALDAIEIGLM